MTFHTLYMTSHTWQHKSYICHFTLSIWDYIHCNCVIKPRVSISFYSLSVCHYTLYVWHHIQYEWHHMNTLWQTHRYRYDIISSIFMTSCSIYMISPILLHENKTTIPGISPTVFDIIATASVWSHPLYQCLYNNYGSLHIWHMYDIRHTLYHTNFRLYDINRQHLGHHKHCINDIRSPIHDITCTVYDISSPLSVTSQPLYR